MRRREFITFLGSAAATWPLAVRAQQPPMPVIGFLTTNQAAAIADRLDAFRKGLAETGFIEGKNVSIEFRSAELHLERLSALTMDLVRRQVAVIFSSGADMPTLMAKGATSTIPIVFVTGYDPVKAGLVASLNRPGGNVTGATVIASELSPKRLELLRELVPNARVAGLIVNPDNPGTEPDIANIQAAARAFNLQIRVVNAGTEDEIDKAAASLAELKPDALMVAPDPLFQNHRKKLIAMIARQSVPGIYYSRDFPIEGGLISYGASFTDIYRQGGIYVGRILKGEKPADLPVVQPTKFELVVNLKTAKALGIEIPQTVMARADEVIE